MKIPKPTDKTKKQNIPPMTLQFFKLKEKHFDVIFMFKVGKFYEFYHMDAQVAIDHLGFKPMSGDTYLKCGTPEMACDRNMRALVEAGFKVARVEQTESAEDFEKRKKSTTVKKWENAVRREICGIASAGTVASANAFDFQDTDKGQASKYFFSIFGEGTRLGVAAVQASRGEWYLSSLHDDDRYASKLLALLSQFDIAQIIIPRNFPENIVKKLVSMQLPIEKRTPSKFWDTKKLLKTLKEKECKWLETEINFMNLIDGLSPRIENSGDVIIPAFAGIVEYFDSAMLLHTVITRPIFKRLFKAENRANKFMQIDSVSQKNLALNTEMLTRIDYTKTAFGKRLLTNWLVSPCMNIETIKKRQEAVAFIADNSDFADFLKNDLLMYDNKRLPDIQVQLQRIKAFSKEGLPPNHPDTRASIYCIEQYAKKNITQFCNILSIMEHIWKRISSIKENYDNLPELLVEILDKKVPNLDKEMLIWKNRFDREAAIETGKIMPRPGMVAVYDEALDRKSEIEQKMENLKNDIADEIGAIRSECVFVTKPKKPYLLECPKEKERTLLKIGFTVDSTKKGSKKTGAKVIVTRKKDLEKMAKKRKEIEDEIEAILRDKVTNAVYIQWIEDAPKWLALVSALTNLDCLLSLAQYANSETGMCLPEFDESEDQDYSFLELKDSKHPCIKLQPGEELISNSLRLEKEKLVILTGPNMGGKSTIMRQVALNIILAQMGSFVPCSSMRLTPVDRIFTRIGGNDHILKGESTFYKAFLEKMKYFNYSLLRDQYKWRNT